jgi:hypothetical protein
MDEIDDLFLQQIASSGCVNTFDMSKLVQDYRELKSLREATKTLTAAAEEAVRILKPTCVSYGGPNPCYCHGGSFDQGVPIEPPHIERECYITDKLEQALKKDK